MGTATAQRGLGLPGALLAGECAGLLAGECAGVLAGECVGVLAGECVGVVLGKLGKLGKLGLLARVVRSAAGCCCTSNLCSRVGDASHCCAHGLCLW